MPYKSDSQRKFMHAMRPKIAAKWDAETGGKIVPTAKAPRPAMKVSHRPVKKGGKAK